MVMYLISLWKDSFCIFKLVEYLKLPPNKYINEIALLLKREKEYNCELHPYLHFLSSNTQSIYTCLQYAIKWAENPMFVKPQTI